MVISAAGGVHDPTAAGTLPSTATSSDSVDLFAQQIESALEQYFGNSGAPGGVTITIQPEASQTNGAGQFLVTVTPQSAPQTSTPATPTPRVTTPQPASPQPAAPQAGSSNSTQTSTTDTPPLGYQYAPFGMSTTLIPTLATEEAQLNAAGAMMSPAQILNQDKVSAAGDPMAGKSVTGTNYNWDDLTQDQQLAYVYAMDWGLPAGQTMQAYLDSNLGPKTMANAPSTNPTLFSAS